MTRHEFWRASYATMLAEIPEDQILEFFADHPMRLGVRVVEGADLLDLLWNESKPPVNPISTPSSAVVN